MTEYSINPKGIVTAFIDGKAAETKRPGEHGYADLLSLANAERTANGKQIFTLPEAERRETISDKSFIGKTINGNGWKILFDPETSRTRVILEAETEQRKQAVIDAGFWYSSVMRSYNKKLTCKAYRAAVKLADTLNAM